MAVASKNIPAPDLVPVRRALLSVSDKTGLVDFARALAGFGVELVSTGGTAKAIAAAGIAGARRHRAHRLSRDHGRPRQDAASGGPWRPARRARRSRACRGHARNGIEPIDLVVVNLYPFEEVRRSGADYAVGGREHRHRRSGHGARRGQEPRLCRRSSPIRATMRAVLNALELNTGSLTLEFRKKLAAKAFARTAAYDAAISQWFAETLEIEHPAWRAFGGQAGKRHALWREPAPVGRLLPHRRAKARRRHRAAAPGQAAFLQQHQRHRRRLRTCRRVRPRAIRRGRDHQARQSLRRRRRRDARRGLSTRRWPAIRSRPSAASSRSTACSTPKRRRRSSRPSPR